MGKYAIDNLDEGAPEPAPEGVPRIVVTPERGGGKYGLDTLDQAPAAKDPWANFNKPFGELKQSDLTPTEATRSAIVGGGSRIGMTPSNAQHAADAVMGIGTSLTPMGAVLSAADFTYHIPKAFSGEHKLANAGNAALDLLGALPGVNYARRGYHALRGTPGYVGGVPELIPAHVAPPPIGRVPRTEPEVRGFVTPTGQEHREAGRAGYRAIEQAPLTYHPNAIAEATDVARNALPSPRIGTGVFTPETAPNTYAMLERFGVAFPRGGPRPVNAYDFDALRQQLLSQRGVEAAAGRQAADIIDTYMLRPPPGMITQGQHLLPALAETYRAARGNWRVYRTGDAVEDAINTARIGAASIHSGKNEGNKTRQAFRQWVATPEGEARLFGATPHQLDRIEDVAVGSPVTNALRSTSTLFGGGGGLGRLGSGSAGTGVGAALGTALGVGPWVGGVVGAGTFMGTGALARRVADARTAREARNVVTEIRQSSPEYARRAALPENAPIADPRIRARDAITMALMPGARDIGQDWINEVYVPYEYR